MGMFDYVDAQWTCPVGEHGDVLTLAGCLSRLGLELKIVRRTDGSTRTMRRRTTSKRRSLRYAVHAGWVTSMNDGQRHFITASRVAELYGLERGEWFEWDEESRLGCVDSDFIHLWPQSSGDYPKVTPGGVDGNLQDSGRIMPALQQESILFVGGPCDGQASAVREDNYSSMVEVHESVGMVPVRADAIQQSYRTHLYHLTPYASGRDYPLYVYVHESLSRNDVFVHLLNGYRRPKFE